MSAMSRDPQRAFHAGPAFWLLLGCAASALLVQPIERVLGGVAIALAILVLFRPALERAAWRAVRARQADPGPDAPRWSAQALHAIDVRGVPVMLRGSDIDRVVWCEPLFGHGLDGSDPSWLVIAGTTSLEMSADVHATEVLARGLPGFDAELVSRARASGHFDDGTMTLECWRRPPAPASTLDVQTKHVHVFVSTGRFRSIAPLRQYIDMTYTEDGEGVASAFIREVDLAHFEPGCIEAVVSPSGEALPIRELLAGASWGDRWLSQVPAHFTGDAAICVHSPNVVRAPEGCSLEHVGCFRTDP